MMITIARDSDAGRVLARAMADPDTYKVSLEVPIAPRAAARVAIKVNEGMWTLPLATEYGR